MQSRHLRQVAARFQQRVFVRSLSGAQLFAVLETTTMLKSVTSRAVAAKTGIFKRFARNQDASAAIEFGFVALPFLALLFAILETALVFFANQTLEAAVANAGRLIMTGQAQTAGYSQADFKKAVCDQIVALFDCTNGVYVKVQTYTDFASTNTTPTITNGQFDTTNMPYVPGGPGDVVVVQLFYQWPITVFPFSSNLSNLNGNSRLLVATSAFRNEPYD